MMQMERKMMNMLMLKQLLEMAIKMEQIPQFDGAFDSEEMSATASQPTMPESVSMRSAVTFNPAHQVTDSQVAPNASERATTSQLTIMPATDTNLSDSANHQSDTFTFKPMVNRAIFGTRMRDIGSLAFELEHGSVLIESTKHENHATTALVKPDHSNPTRIGLVFYQHKNLIFSNHGLNELKVRDFDKMGKYYKMMQTGEFIPTERQLRMMLDQGFKFPQIVLVAPPRKPRDGSGHELPLDIIASTHGCYFINNPSYVK